MTGLSVDALAHLTLLLRVPTPGCGSLRLTDFEFESGTLRLDVALEGLGRCPDRTGYEQSILIITDLDPTRLDTYFDGVFVESILLDAG